MIRRMFAAVMPLIVAAAIFAGCERDTSGLAPAPADTDPVVFTDNFGNNVDFQAFQYSDFNALSIDATVRHSGSASLKVTVPDPGSYAGGALTTSRVRDLTGYDGITFWAKASKTATLNVAGLGNDNTGTSKYEASWKLIPLSTEWKKYIIPIPLPSRLQAEGGLFYFAEDSDDEGGAGYDIWFDDIVFESLEPGTITDPRPAIADQTIDAFVGASVNITGTSAIFDVNGTDQTIEFNQGYLTYFSSNEDVVKVDGELISVVGPGTAQITASLRGVSATGQVTLNAADAPTVPAPDPTDDPSLVISLFSDVYDDITVDTWSADWPDMADVQDFQVDGNAVKAYTNLIYAGITFQNNPVDATDMDYFHIDVWLPPNVTSFKVKLVNFNEGGTLDSQSELTFGLGTSPALTPGAWSSLDIPLAEFMGPSGLINRDRIAQLLISGSNITAFVDNVYFHKTAVTASPAGK